MTTTTTGENSNSPLTGEVLDYIDLKRQEILNIALGELGWQSKGSPQVLRYWLGVAVLGFDDRPISAEQKVGCANNADWCGIFAFWCWTQARITAISSGLSANSQELVWRLGRGLRFHTRPLSALETRSLKTHPAGPDMGDIVVVKKYWHHAIVKNINRDENLTPILHTVDGNQPGAALRSRPLDSLYHWYPVAPLILTGMGLGGA